MLLLLLSRRQGPIHWIMPQMCHGPGHCDWTYGHRTRKRNDIVFSFQHCCNHMQICHSNFCPKIPNLFLRPGHCRTWSFRRLGWQGSRRRVASWLRRYGVGSTWCDVTRRGTCSVAGCGLETGGAHGGALRWEFGPGVKLGAEKRLTSWEYRRHLQWYSTSFYLSLFIWYSVVGERFHNFQIKRSMRTECILNPGRETFLKPKSNLDLMPSLSRENWEIWLSLVWLPLCFWPLFCFQADIPADSIRNVTPEQAANVGCRRRCFFMFFRTEPDHDFREKMEEYLQRHWHAMRLTETHNYTMCVYVLL